MGKSKISLKLEYTNSFKENLEIVMGAVVEFKKENVSNDLYQYQEIKCGKYNDCSREYLLFNTHILKYYCIDYQGSE